MDLELQKNLRIFRKKIKNAKPYVDDKPPHFVPLEELNTKRVKRTMAEATQLQKDNLTAVKRMALQLRSSGQVNTFRKPGEEITIASKMEYKRQQLIRITEQNVELKRRIENMKPVYVTQKFLQSFHHAMAIAQRNSKFAKQKKKEEVDRKRTLLRMSSSPQDFPVLSRTGYYFDIMIDNQIQERMIIMGYDDIVPKTVENFRHFCIGENGYGYAYCPFYRIIPGILCRTGDVTHYNGFGGTSIYGNTFEDENFILKHSEPGMVSMINKGPNTNNSKFQIIFKPLHSLDGKSVVFGKVVKGLRALHDIGSCGFKSGKVRIPVFIVRCGQLKHYDSMDL